MQIVWDVDAVEHLKRSHTVLELETIAQADGKMITAYCVISPEQIGINGFARLETDVQLHAAFISAHNAGDQKLCRETAEHLIGQFSGEMDSFYEHILARF